jgi:hypothetical protein
MTISKSPLIGSTAAAASNMTENAAASKPKPGDASFNVSQWGFPPIGVFNRTIRPKPPGQGCDYNCRQRGRSWGYMWDGPKNPDNGYYGTKNGRWNYMHSDPYWYLK